MNTIELKTPPQPQRRIYDSGDDAPEKDYFTCPSPIVPRRIVKALAPKIKPLLAQYVLQLTTVVSLVIWKMV